MEDNVIINLYFKRDEDAIKQTDLKYGRLSFMIANNILNDIPDSEECVNDTYISLWNQIPPTNPTNFKAFLCKITRNLSLKKLEYKLAMKRNISLETSFNELEEFIPDNSIESTEEELTLILNKFLKSLKEETRVIFVKRYWFNESIKTISDELEKNEDTIKSTLFRTRSKLKKYLKREGVYHE